MLVENLQTEYIYPHPWESSPWGCSPCRTRSRWGCWPCRRAAPSLLSACVTRCSWHPPPWPDSKMTHPGLYHTGLASELLLSWKHQHFTGKTGIGIFYSPPCVILCSSERLLIVNTAWYYVVTVVTINTSGQWHWQDNHCTGQCSQLSLFIIITH